MSKKVLIFDLETTGTDKNKDRIIEFGGILMDWDKFIRMPVGSTMDNFKVYADKVVKRAFLPDDGTEVSIGAYSKHRLTRELLKDCPSFESFVPECEALFNQADIIITYNGMAFDIPMLSAELQRYNRSIDWSSKIFFDAFVTEKERFSHTLEKVYNKYVGCTMSESGLTAHGAIADTIATANIFNAQNAIMPQPARTYLTDDGFLVIQDWEGKPTVCINHGKYHGIALREIIKSDLGYINWILSSSFSLRTKAIIRKALEKFATSQAV